jgi:WD40 repeat protein
MAYDAFISYSHAADGQLAPAVQSGLQRLARPWYKLRALHVFRDETGLAVNPHLWVSIQDALDESDWFVLMCSPDAAASPWVEREVEHWLANKPAERILPVLTAGMLAWDEVAGDFTPDSHVPPALRGVYASEPKFLDLRWAHDEEQVDLHHSRFRDAIASLAAPMHGLAKDELESEDVRMHRRARRLARAAIVLLALLTIGATTASAFALSNASRAHKAEQRAQSEADKARDAELRAREEAEHALELQAFANTQADKAQRENRRATEKEADALRQAQLANEAKAEAQEQTAIAEAAQAEATIQAQLATEAAAVAREQTAIADEERQKAIAAADEAQKERDRASTQAALARLREIEARAASARADREAALARQQRDLAFNRALAARGLAQPLEQYDLGLLLSVEASRRSSDSQVRDSLVRNLQRRPALLSHFLPGTVGTEGLAVSPDGSLLASTGDGRAELVRLADGGRIPLATSAAFGDPVFSGDGSRLAVAAGAGIDVFDISGGSPVLVRSLRGDAFAFTLDAPGVHLARVVPPIDGGDPQLEVHDLATRTSRAFPLPVDYSIGPIALSPDASLVAVSGSQFFDDNLLISLFDVATGTQIGRTQAAHSSPPFGLGGNRELRMHFQPAGGGLELVSVAPLAQDDIRIVWDAETMDPLSRDPRPPLGTNEHFADISPDGTLIVTALGRDGIARLRGLDGSLIGELPANLDIGFQFADFLADVKHVRFTTNDGIVAIGIDGRARRFSTAPIAGPMLRTYDVPLQPFGDSRVSHDGRWWALSAENRSAVILVDARTGDVAHVLAHGFAVASTLSFSPDGNRIAVVVVDDVGTPQNEARLLVWDTGTGASLLSRELDATGTAPEWSPDGRVLAMTSFPGQASAVTEFRDSATGRLLARFGDATHSFRFAEFVPGTHAAVMFDDQGLRAVDDRTFAFVEVPPISTHLALGTTRDYSLDGRRAVSIADGVLRIWDLPKATTLHTIALGELTLSNAVAISPDGETVAVMDARSDVRLFDADDGAPLGSSFRGVPIGVFTPSGELVSVSFENQASRIFRLDVTPSRWRAAACALANRNLTRAQWSQFVGSGEPHLAC